MRPAILKQLVRERLQSWGDLMVAEHATPFVAVAVGHDHKSGNLVVTIPDDVSREDVVTLLQRTIKLFNLGGDVS